MVDSELIVWQKKNQFRKVHPGKPITSTLARSYTSTPTNISKIVWLLNKNGKKKLSRTKTSARFKNAHTSTKLPTQLLSRQLPPSRLTNRASFSLEFPWLRAAGRFVGEKIFPGSVCVWCFVAIFSQQKKMGFLWILLRGGYIYFYLFKRFDHAQIPLVERKQSPASLFFRAHSLNVRRVLLHWQPWWRNGFLLKLLNQSLLEGP